MGGREILATTGKLAVVPLDSQCHTHCGFGHSLRRFVLLLASSFFVVVGARKFISLVDFTCKSLGVFENTGPHQLDLQGYAVCQVENTLCVSGSVYTGVYTHFSPQLHLLRITWVPLASCLEATPPLPVLHTTTQKTGE